MKKLIAISVMCALVAGAAFADTTFGGQIFVGGKFFSGDNEEGSHIQTGALGYDNYNTLVKITFGDSTAGGWMGLHNNNGTYYHGFAWWRPIPQLRFQIGRNQDGDWGGAQISGWGFTGEAKNAGGIGAMPEYSGYGEGRNHARVTGWYPGVDRWSFNTSIYPIEGLTINLAIPFTDSEAIAFTYSRVELNVQYRITDIGTAALSFQSNTGYIEGDPSGEAWYGTAGQSDPGKSPKIYASFFLTAIESMAIDLGLAYKFPFNNTADSTKTYHPFEIGLGYRVNVGDFQFKLRSSISVAGSTDVQGADPVKDPTQVSINILPNYKIGSVTVYFYAGMGIQIADDWEKPTAGSIFKNSGSNAVVAWFVNPYVLIPAGGMRFLAGIQIYSDGVGYPYYQQGTLKYDSAKISWGIPFGFYTYF